MSEQIKVNGKYLRKIRDDKNFSRDRLVEKTDKAGEAGISLATLIRMETDPEQKFRRQGVHAVANALGIPLAAITEEIDGEAPVECERVDTGGMLFNLIKGSEGYIFHPGLEPAAAECHGAIVKLFSTLKHCEWNKFGRDDFESLGFEQQYEIRQCIEALKENGIGVFAGECYRLEYFNLMIELEREVTKWSGCYDPATGHPAYDLQWDGMGFRKLVLITISETDEDQWPMKIDVNPFGFDKDQRWLRGDVERVLAGLPPKRDGGDDGGSNAN